MVWYNITAYNIKVKLVLRNNKEKVICNNKNAEGVMQMKCSKNLERAIVLGLILSTGVCGSAWAADIEFYGKASPSGDTYGYEIKENINGININVAGSEKTYDTTAALIFKTGNKHNVTGDIYIVNTVDAPDGEDSSLNISNNDGLQVIDGSKVDIKGNDVYIASVGGSGNKIREDYTTTYMGIKLEADIEAWKKSTALSVGIGRDNSIDISGDNIKIIGNIDFTDDKPTAILNGNTNNTITLCFNSKNSYFYGDVYDRMIIKNAEINLSNQIFGIDKDISISNKSLVGMKQGSADITLKNGAEWIYDEIPLIENLKLDGGVVVLDDEYIKSKYENEIVKVYNEENVVVDTVKLSDYRSDASHDIVKIDNLTGSGIFKANLDWVNSQNKKYTYNQYYKNYNESVSVGSIQIDVPITQILGFNPGTDYIFIDNSKVGTTQIIDFDASKAHLDQMKIGKDRLYFANVADSGTDFVTVNGTKQAVSSGAGNIFSYEYRVGSEENKVTNSIAKDNTTENTATQPDGTEFYIEVTGKSAEGNANFESAKGAMYAGYALGTELDTLNKRMGEARYLEDDNGVWVRYRHAKTGWDDTFETNSDMFQLGFDKQVQEDDGTHYRGVAVDYTDADTSLMHASGDGENKRYAVSLYDTWIGEKGHYRDLVLRGGRINSDYDISGMFDNGMADIGGDYHQWFGSISAEWGRKNDMQSGWYFEPQVQAQLARIGGASYVSDSGVDVDQDGATSLIGRAGFRIGREYVKDNGKHDNFYIKADLLHEFMGDKGIALSTATERYTDEYDGQETWFDIGLGADISIGKNSFFWADVERTLGADFDNTWQINGGFRWEF